MLNPWETKSNTTPSERLSDNFGANVKRLRVEQGLNKKVFALMCGIGRPMLNAIENCTADVRLSYVHRIADALSVHPLVLLASPPEEDE